jgi:hypothetical protein
MTRNCHIKFELEHSRLVISAFDQESGRSEQITRGVDSIERINQMSEMYRMLVARRSFADEDDLGVISTLEQLGEQLYVLFFSGLEDLLEPCSSLLLEHDMFLLPLELASNGQEFIGLKYAVGNWMRGFGRAPHIEPRESDALEVSKDFRALFLGDENESVFDVFFRERVPICERMRSTWAEYLLEQLNSKRYDVLHFAGHGRFDETHPKLSFLVLDQERAGQDESALLRCDQLESARLYHTLVVLNACQSGRVEENYLGFVGFVDSIFRSGATSCITTLWSISDKSATRFVVDFYTNLFRGAPIGEALRKARLKCWLEKRDVLTSFSYVLFGNPSRLIKIGPEGQVEVNPDKEE